MTGVTTAQIIRAYATENGGDIDDDDDDIVDFPDPDADPNPDPDPSPDPDPEPTPPAPTPDPEPIQPAPTPDPEQPDPFDYNLVCYTPDISFGTVEKGSIVPAKQFSIVNVGQTTFPLTWTEIDPYTAFDIGSISPSLNMSPGDSVTFSISPYEDLAPGTYVCHYNFFSENDFRMHHVAKVTVSITVKDNTPYISDVTISPGQVTIPAGKSYKFDVTVAGGNGYDPSVTWSLTGNQSAGTTIDSSGKLTVSRSETAQSFAVIATSRQNPSVDDRAVVSVTSVDYMVTVKGDPSDGGAVAGGGAVKSGGSATISASPNNNFTFKGWYEGGNLISNSGSITLNNITCDRNMIAKFERKSCFVKTSVNNGDAGTVTGSTSVAYGGSITLKAEAKSGYTFAGFVENNSVLSTASSIQLNNVTTDRNIIAVFDRAKCNVNVSVYPQDTGKYEGAGTYNKNSRVELRSQAYDGYESVGWSINGQMVSTDAKYTIKEIKSDVNVVANFKKKDAPTYKLVSGIANAGGSIVPSGDYIVAQGGSVTYNIFAQADYRINAVIVDGKNIGAVSSYTFNNVNGAHTITASFEKKPVQQPAANPTSAKTSTTTAAASTKSNTTDTGKTENTKKTQFNGDTAADGAVQEQNLISDVIPGQATELEGEDYEDDRYIPAEDFILEEPKPVVEGSVMAKHNMDEDTLRILVEDNAVLPMLREAFEDGTLQITVNNSYAADTQETAATLYYDRPSLTNFEDVIAETLTKEEKMAVLTGTPISFNIDIYENTSTVDEGTKKLMQKKVGYRPVSYFDFTIMKTSGGSTTLINNTDAELEVVLPIPEQFRKHGRKFYIIRSHNGVVDVLDDMGDDDETTVTFRTDRFSEYAIAYEAVNVNKLILRIIIISFVSLILAIICFVNLVKYRRSARRARG